MLFPLAQLLSVSGLVVAVTPPAYGPTPAARSAHNLAIEEVKTAIGYSDFHGAQFSHLYGAREKVGKDGCVVVAEEWPMLGIISEFAVTIMGPDHIEIHNADKDSFVVGGPVMGNFDYPAVQLNTVDGVKTFRYYFKGAFPNTPTHIGETFEGQPKLVVYENRITVTDIYGDTKSCEVE
jgi:hypothetical protein